MLLRARELVNLEVVTRSGMHIGWLVGFEFEAESQTILRYEVRRSLLSAPFLVSRDQVVTIDAKQMVVEDAVAPAEIGRKLVMQKPEVLSDSSLQREVE